MDRASKERICRLVAELNQQYGFSDQPECEPPAAVHEVEPGQLSLLQITPPGAGAPCVAPPPTGRGRREVDVGQSACIRYSDPCGG